MESYLIRVPKNDQVRGVDLVREHVRKNWPAGTYFEVRQGIPTVSQDGLSIEIGAFEITEAETYPPCLGDFGRIYLAAFFPAEGYYIVSREKV